MSTTTPTILILGAGSNIGLSVAQKFASEGWNVAAAGRNPSDELKKVAHLVLSADFADPEGAIQGVFEGVEGRFGAPPDVVVYNAYSLAFAPSSTDPFTIPISSFAKDLAVNTTSVYASLFHAVKGFRSLASSSSSSTKSKQGVFIYTGNMQNTLIVPETFSLGAGKNATAYLIETAAAMYGANPPAAAAAAPETKTEEPAADAAPPAHFYYADQRLPSGGSVMAAVDGAAHAAAFWELANRESQGCWDWTFVKGEGYRKFEAEREREVKGMMVLMGEAERELGVKFNF